MLLNLSMGKRVEIKTYLNEQRQLVEQHLATLMLKPEGSFATHIDAMRYSLFIGGKRLRPILCLAGARAVNNNPDLDNQVLPFACALECIHTYSLIHDDLPAMDNDALRRGKPTNHMVYGEAAAVLAGDGLLTFSFELMSQANTSKLPAEARLRIIETIARAAGPTGMVGGQSLDMAYEGKQIPFELLQVIHRSKTGALITASVVCGAIAAGADEAQEEALASYGSSIGLAFQIVDDLLDVEATTEQLGKPAGSDVDSNKVTYPSMFGLDASKKMAREAVDNAITALEPFGEQAAPLQGLAAYIVERKR